MEMFECDLSENLIEYKMVGEKIFMERVEIDYDYPKLFFILLRKTVDGYIEKGYKKLVQTVTYDDWKYIKDKGKWNVVDSVNSLIIIECDINDAIENIAKGLGFDE